ncbi:MAG: lamin tail domain-containing protein, partial [Sphingobacteriales bacterium]|nr:lamin tail domain-containing protein [Sphingobacteriales bacterium]
MPNSDRGMGGDIKIVSGTLNLNGSSGDLYVSGNWIRSGGTFNCNNRAVFFQGSSSVFLQTVTNPEVFNYLFINKTSGATFTINNNIQVDNNLTLNAILTGAAASTVIIPSGSGVTRNSGHINAYLQRAVNNGTTVFDIGSASVYAPSTIVTSSSTGLVVSGRVFASNPPNTGSGINQSAKSNHYWIFNQISGTVGAYDASFNFSNTSNTGNVNNYRVRKYSGGAWQSTTSSSNGTSATATGLTSFSDFEVGELTNYTITASAGANGSISPSGSVTVADGNNQTFTIAANACYSIADLLVDGVSVGAVSTYIFSNVKANHTISASFTLNKYTITASAGTGGTISPSGGVSVNCGSDQTFTITPAACYSIADVLVDGSSVGAVGTYTFTNVTAGHTISASFVLKTYTITASAGSGGSISPSGSVSVNCGSDQSFTITADAGYHIVDVLVDGSSVGVVGSYNFTNVSATHTISASFAVNNYTISASADAGGSISPSGSVDVTQGADQSFTIAADPCYSISDVTVDGNSVGAVSTYTFTNVQANHTIHASFVYNNYTITASAGSGGSVSDAGATTIGCAGSKTYTFTAADCYQIADVLVDGVSVGNVSEYTFTNIQANHTISVSFNLITYTVTVTAGTGGTVTPRSGSVNCGTSPSYTIAANSCYSIADVVVDGSSLGAVGIVQFTNIHANHTISVIFNDDHITPLVSLSVSPGNSVCANTPVTFTAIASPLGGGTPTYTFKVGTTIVQTGSSNQYITSSLSNGAIVTCEVDIADGTCLTATHIVSSGITMTIKALPVASISISETSGTTNNDGTICADASVTLTASGGASYSWSSGQSTAAITVSPSATTTYTVTVTGANGCTAQASQTITVNPLPATPTITPSGATTFCAGGSVTLTSSQASGNVWSTGATTQSIVVSASASYTVTYTDGNGCSATSAITGVTVNPTPAAPTISASGATTFCAGGSVTLTSSQANNNVWSTGATTQSIVVSASGSYSVKYTDANGCVSPFSASRSVTVNPTPSAPTISASGATTFCADGSVTLTSSEANNNVWSTGATTQSIVVSASGSYSVKYTDGNGCVSPFSASTSVTVNPLPATPTITASGATTFCAGGSVTLTSSQASGNVWSTGATTQSIVVSATGNYTVTYTDGNGCSATSAATVVTVNPLPVATISSVTPVSCVGGTNGAIDLSVSGGTATVTTTTVGSLTQDFSTLASSGTSQTLPSVVSTTTPIAYTWAFTESGSNADVNYTAGTGSGTSGDTYSFGATSSNERAFGGLRSGTVIPVFGASFKNNSGVTVNNVIIGYTGEQWRLGATGRNDKIEFEYSTNATSLTTGTWIRLSGLDFTAPISTGTAGALNGNLAANRTVISPVTISSLSIANGSTIWIRWNDIDVTGSDDGLAVDDFSLSMSSSSSSYNYLWSNNATTQDIFGLSTGLYSVTVTDNAGCTATASATVTQQDNVLPAVITKAVTVNLDATGNASISADDVNNGSTDNCGIATKSVNPSSFNCSNVTGPTPTDLIISEYLEGSGNSKVIEIYNGTNTTVDLSTGQYALKIYANGNASATSTINLTGTIAAGGTYVVANSGSSSSILNVANQTSGSLSFNGNDAVALTKGAAGSFVDIFGRIGNDPGTAWTGSGGYTTVAQTLRRKSTITTGITTSPTGTGPSAFTTLTSEWDLIGLDITTGLGSHYSGNSV